MIKKFDIQTNQLKIGVILSSLTTAISLLIKLIYTPVMIRILGQSDYGLFTLAASIVSYLSLFSLGFNGSYLRFYARYNVRNDNESIAQLNGLFLVLFSLMGLTALVCGMILAHYPAKVFGEKLTVEELQRSQVLMRILVINLALSFPTTVFQSIVTSKEKFIWIRVLALLQTVLNPLVALPLLLMGWGSVGVVIASTAVSVLNLALYMYYCLIKLATRFRITELDISLLKEISFFSFFLFINMLIDQLNWQVDKLILGRVSGTNSVAIYGAGTQFNTIFLTLGSILTSVLGPRVNNIVARNEEDMDDQLTNELIKVGRLQLYLMLYITVGFVFAGKKFITFWLGSDYGEAYYVALFLVLPLIIALPKNLGIEIRRAKNKHQMASIILLITTIANVLVSIPLAMRFGAIGAAFGTFLCLLINMVLIDVYYIRVINLNMMLFYKNFLGILAILSPAVIMGLLGLLISDARLIVLWIMFYTVIYGVLMYTRAMNQNEKQYVVSILKRIRMRGNQHDRHQ